MTEEWHSQKRNTTTQPFPLLPHVQTLLPSQTLPTPPPTIHYYTFLFLFQVNHDEKRMLYVMFSNNTRVFVELRYGVVETWWALNNFIYTNPQQLTSSLRSSSPLHFPFYSGYKFALSRVMCIQLYASFNNSIAVITVKET